MSSDVSLQPHIRKLCDHRGLSGEFVRLRQAWDFSRWDDGYVDKKGRFRVYRPDYPRAWSDGYAFRYHVVLWLTTGQVVSKRLELHHKNEDPLDDRFENLEPLTNAYHQLVHKDNSRVLVCQGCGIEFVVPAWRISQRPTKYCSQKCYHENFSRDRRPTIICGVCGVGFKVQATEASRRRYCSIPCYSIARRSKFRKDAA